MEALFCSVPAAVSRVPILRTALFLDPEAQKGLRPSRACAQRFLWFRDKRLRELLAGVSNDFEMRHYEAAVLENPARIAEMERQYLDAFRWERQRYGNCAAWLNAEKKAVAA